LPGAAGAQVDADKIQRVLFNLLSNACKFTPVGGRIVITAQIEAGKASVSVADSGPGVPPDARELIFERFRQADGGATRRVGGTGLGLYIVKEFIRLHGGTVSVSEAALGGARFLVEFPLDAPAGYEVHPWARHSDESLSLELSTLATHPDPGAADGARLARDAACVLVVEDNPDMNAFVARVLSQSYRVLRAFDAAQGLAMALRNRPDLILTDIMMPGHRSR
jgi:hypothetical protein